MIGQAVVGEAEAKGPLSFPNGKVRGSLWRTSLDRRTLLAGLLVFVGYFLGVKLGLALTFQPHPVSVMWPPNAILLAALLLTPLRAWWFLLLCALPAHLLAELQSLVPLKMVLCWFISNCSEGLIGAAGTRFIIGSTGRFDQVRTVGALFLFAGLIAPALSSFLDAAFVSFNQFGQQGYWQVWRMRFFSNVFAEMMLVPAIVTWSTVRPAPGFVRKLRTSAELAILLLSLLAVSARVFLWEKVGPTTNPTLLYTPLPFLLWVAVRFGPVGTSNAILPVALVSIWGAVHGRGPFISGLPEQNALAIQVFLS